ncbi:formate/nitrite transporter family protein [Actinoplanes sp. NBC_00393]
MATKGPALAFAGNLVGAVVFVATSYWYMYLRDDHDAPDQQPSR